MRKIQILLVLLSLNCVCVKAQSEFEPFAIIKDKDGYTNVRDKNNKIIDRLHNNQVFYDWGDKNDNGAWYHIEYGNAYSKKTDKTKFGYIHRSRILHLYDLPKLKKKTIGKNQVEFTNETLKISIKTANFVPSKHKITRTKEGYMSKIDGEEFWGNIGDREIEGKNIEITTEIEAITISTRGGTYKFPKSTIQNLYDVYFESMYVAKNNSYLFLVTSAGDGAESYRVVWTIKDNKVVSQFINDGEYSGDDYDDD